MKIALWTLFCALFCSASFAAGQVIRHEDFRDNRDGMPGEQMWEKVIKVGANVALTARVDVTAKGNGTLHVANLNLRVFDEHDDGEIYQGGLLHVEFIDLNGTGYKNLVITGIVIHTGEKESDPRNYEAITSIYAFNPTKKEYDLVFHCGPDIDLARFRK